MPIQIGDPKGAVSYDVGGISFEGCTLVDDRNRTWLEATALNATLVDAHFGFVVNNPNGCRSPVIQDRSINVTVNTTCHATNPLQPLLPQYGRDQGQRQGPASTAVALVLPAKGFVLSILHNCTAFLTDTNSGHTNSGHTNSGGQPRTGSLVPLAMLYNRVSDSQEVNMDACVSATIVETPRGSTSSSSPTNASTNSTVTAITLAAAHGYGSVEITISSSPLLPYLVFTVVKVEHWLVEEKILAFGTFWDGLGLDDTTLTQMVMGKLQGPRSLNGLSAAVAKTAENRGSNVNTAPSPPSAGFLTLSSGSYYRYIFNTTVGDAVGFVYARTEHIDDAWQLLASNVGTSAPLVTSSKTSPSPVATPTHEHQHQHQHLQPELPGVSDGWFWTDGNSNATNTDAYIARAKALGCKTLMLTGIVDGSTWSINKTAYPSGIKATVDRIRAAGLRVGLHTLPYPPSSCVGRCSADNLLQEGLAPTYRSGSIGHSRMHVWYYTEDLGVWWGHEGVGSVASNGNPHKNQYGYECPQRVTYNCSRWGANMSLHNTRWSPLGRFRQGGSIEFNGADSFGLVEQADGDGIVSEGLHHATGITLGLVAHPYANRSACGVMTLAYLHGSFQLSLVGGGVDGNSGDDCGGGGHSSSSRENTDATGNRSAGAGGWRVRWSVWTEEAGMLVTESAQPVVYAGRSNIVKATFNGTASSVNIFVNNVQVSPRNSSSNRPRPSRLGKALAGTPPRLPPLLFGADASDYGADDDPSAATTATTTANTRTARTATIVNGSNWYNGSLEEIYLKNVSTESRTAYVYTDNVRPNPGDNVRIFDFLRPSGRNYFARLMSTLLNSDGVYFDVTQWDGFEIQQV